MEDLIRISEQASVHYTFLFTDIEGSTKRWAMFPTEMGAALARHDALLRDVVSAAGGVVFKTMGDGGCAVFAKADGAIRAAAMLQIRLAAEDFTAIDGLRFRIGVHVGPAEFRDNDYFGLTLARTKLLMAAGHGGQILVSATVSQANAVASPFSLRSLGQHRLKDLGQEEEIFQLIGPGLADDFPPLNTVEAKPNNLPLQLSRFIGREAELATLGGLLAAHRLVTLLGAGGIGKTRLAVQTASAALAHYPDGVWLVELAGLGDAEQVAPAVAAALTIALHGLGAGNPDEQLSAALRGATLLIILDNCEHLIEAASRLAGVLLRRNPGITILATSRSPLGLPGEQRFALPSLAVPEPDRLLSLTVETARGYAAISLFVERAGLAQPEFTLDASTVADVAVICQRLDGIPLAIELAASRMRLRTPRELVAGLDNRFRLLVGGTRGGPARQRTLRTMMDWSHDLLSAEEALCLARLGAFGGSFSLDAASEIIGTSPLHPDRIIDLLSELLDQSLITVLPASHAASRYRLHETMRYYLREKLNDADRTPIMARLCIWLLDHYRAAEAAWPTTQADDWRASFALDLDNLRAGLAWAFGPQGDRSIGLALICATSPLWRDLGLSAEQRHWLELAVSHLDAATPDAIAARIGLDIAFAGSGGAFGDKRKIGPALDALERYQRLDQPENLALAAGRVAVCLAAPRAMAAAQPYIDVINAALPLIGVNRNRAWLLNILGTVAHLAEDAPRAVALLNEAIAISIAFNDTVNLQMARLNLAEIKFADGDPAGALSEAQAVTLSCRSTGNLLDLGFTLGNIACYALALDDRPTAHDALIEALPLVSDFGIELVFVACLQSTALLAIRCGAPEAAARLAGFTEHYYLTNAITREVSEQAINDALIASLDHAALTATLMPDRRYTLAAEARSWSMAEALTAAQMILDQIKPRITPDRSIYQPQADRATIQRLDDYRAARVSPAA